MTLDQGTTRAQLARAARDLLLEGGLTAVSMRRVAQACGISAPAIYRHYDDKDALVTAAILEGFRTFGSYLLDALEQPTPEQRFRHLGQRYFDFALEHPQDYRLMFMTDCGQLNMTQLDETSQREIDGTFQLLQDRVAECQREGVFSPADPRTVAAYVWSSVHGLASLMVNGNLGSSAEERDALTEQQLDRIDQSLRAS